MQREDLLVWMDLEMTGLNPQTDCIIEAGVVITDAELAIIAEGPEIIIHAPEEAFERMVPKVREMHTQNKLIDASRAGMVTEAEAEETLLSFIASYVAPHSAPLCGNSIHVDRMFLHYRMPRIDAYLHYRHIDVSSVKGVVSRWHREVYEEYKATLTEKTHRVKDDILQSIDELRFYKKRFFEN